MLFLQRKGKKNHIKIFELYFISFIFYNVFYIEKKIEVLFSNKIRTFVACFYFPM
jgi:hypothetical protein